MYVYVPFCFLIVFCFVVSNNCLHSLLMQSLITSMAHKLPDGGADLHRKKKLLTERLNQMKKPVDMEILQSSGSILTSKKGLTFQAKIMTTNVVEHLHM